jgi:hypothetical protein
LSYINQLFISGDGKNSFFMKHKDHIIIVDRENISGTVKRQDEVPFPHWYARSTSLSLETYTSLSSTIVYGLSLSTMSTTGATARL